MHTWMIGTASLIIALATSPFSNGAEATFALIDQQTSAPKETVENGYDVALELKRRYNDAATKCNENDPVLLHCSGLLVYEFDRPQEDARFRWYPSEQDESDGGVSFTYLRQDLRSPQIRKGYYGYVFYPTNLTPLGKSALKVACGYPARVDSDNRTASGCGQFYSRASSIPGEFCESNSAENWVSTMNYLMETQPGDVYKLICSFDLQQENFSEFIKAINHPKTPFPTAGNTLVVRAWSKADPAQAPLEAIIITETAPSLLTQDMQEEYFSKSGRFVPAINILYDKNGKITSFTYHPELQFDPSTYQPKKEIRSPEVIAAALQSRLTIDTCKQNKLPAYECNGVIARGYETSNDGEIWNIKQKDIDKGGVSASFLRNDLTFAKFAYDHTHGIIFYPKIKTPQDKLQIKVLCGFPIDAYTDDRKPHACDAYPAFPQSSSCQKQSPAILTATAWIKHYNSVSIEDRRYHQCSFDFDTTPPSSATFAEFVKAANQIDVAAEVKSSTDTQPAVFSTQNELILSPWDSTSPAAVPVEAFFYINGNTPGRNSARTVQQLFFNKTGGQWVPIVRLQLPATASELPHITYSDADQGVRPSNDATSKVRTTDGIP